MSSTILKPLAQSLVDLADGITLTNGVEVTGYLWERKDFASLPAVAVEPPDGRRRGIDEGESQLGSDDWFPEYHVSLYVDLDDAVVAQEQMLELLEAYIAAVDADPSLGDAEVLDAKVTRWEKFTRTTAKRTLAGYDVTVSVYRLV